MKLLKDPLLHFLALGALLFAVAALRGGDDESDPARIEIDALVVERIAGAAERLYGRPPSRDELRELLEPTIREEVLYRESLALGLDVDDDEVRRRLIEKMQYLTENLADPKPPSEQTLRAFFTEAPERFLIPEAVTFEQIFFSAQMRGDTLEADIDAALSELARGVEPIEVGDRTPLQMRYDAAERERVAVLFGDSFADALFSLEPDGWQGPYRSDFGMHLVRLTAHRSARQPEFDEVRDEVAAAYAAAARAERNEAEYARMRARYDVVIEWPGAEPVGGES